MLVFQRFALVLAGVVVAFEAPGFARATTPPPTISVPSGFTSQLVLTQDRLSAIGFDQSGSLLAATHVPGDECSDLSGVLERVNADGSTTALMSGFAGPQRILLGPGGVFGNQLYVVDSNAGGCGGKVFRIDPQGPTGVASFGNLGNEPRGGAFDPTDGTLWIPEADTVGSFHDPDSGMIDHLTAPGTNPAIALSGPPLGSPTDDEFGPGGAYGSSLYVSDAGEESFGGTRATLFRMTNGSVTPFVQAPSAGERFWRFAFAPSGPFGGLMYVVDTGPASTASRLVTVDPSGTISTFATLQSTAAGQGIIDVLPSPDGSALYVLVAESQDGAADLYKVTPASAARYGSDQLDPSRCGLTKQSRNVVNVSFRLVNDYDSGVHGNAWANDTVHREIRIWRLSPTGNTFCATVTDTAKFATFAGDSPGGSGHVSAGIAGSFVGGELTGQFTGSLNASPPYPTNGEIGPTLSPNTFDLQCTDAYTCPGAAPSISSYVSGYDGRLAWWGWQYTTDGHGIWTDSSDGITGDITG